MRFFMMKKFAVCAAIFTLGWASTGMADGDPAQNYPGEDPAATQEVVPSREPLQQFGAPEITPITASQGAEAVNPTPNTSGMDFPKVKTLEDERLAKQFSWWPSDAKPAPVKDTERSGYWWWPEVPGEVRPWGNQGFVYVRKIIFDYKSSEGELKPSLIIKRILRNVKAYFDYDKADLREDARDILSKAVYTMEKNPQTDILITGNADIRGSEKYNLKLGEKRAASIKQFMLDNGISEDRIRILSRGKMDALAPAHDLVGMQKDRNAQFMIAEVEEVMIPAEKAALFQDKIIEEKQEIESAVRVDSKEYVIQSGDTLWGIAKREYGDGNQWKRIYEFNKDVIANPNRPKKGSRIQIPIE